MYLLANAKAARRGFGSDDTEPAVPSTAFHLVSRISPAVRHSSVDGRRSPRDRYPPHSLIPRYGTQTVLSNQAAFDSE